MKFQEFSIKELESFSGVKAHTIRIWEQRYGLLAPERSGTNIRRYSDKDLKLLLNVSLLNSFGYKISRIAGWTEQEMHEMIAAHTRPEHAEQQHLHILKIAMLNYDEYLFNSVLDPQLALHGLAKTFLELIVPFLKQVGYLWQTGAICPAQEHFVSSLIRQKMLARLNSLPVPEPMPGARPVVLFLPAPGMNDLSLIMIGYMLRQAGRAAILLGAAIPLEDLQQVHQRLGAADFVSAFTMHPTSLPVQDYLRKLAATFAGTGCHFHLAGHTLAGQSSPDVSLITLYPGVTELSKHLS